MTQLLTDILHQLGEIQDGPIEIQRPEKTQQEQDDAPDAEHHSASAEQDRAGRDKESMIVSHRTEDKTNWRTATSREILVTIYELFGVALTERQHGKEKNAKERT